jgi:hypothetical protein
MTIATVPPGGTEQPWLFAGAVVLLGGAVYLRGRH